MLRLILLATVSSLLLGCASLPGELQAAKDVPVVTKYSDWTAHSEVSGKTIRLGGVVAKVTNDNNITRLEIVNVPIASNGKPLIEHDPKGRFVAYIKGFAEPISLKGRLVTVLGTSKGTEKGQIDKQDYVFPVMDVLNYHLWHVRERMIDTFPNADFKCGPSILCREHDSFYGGQTIKVVE